MSKELYRDPTNGKLSGVCAGIDNFFGLEVWLVRILFISFAMLSGFFLVLLVYVALSFMLEPQPVEYQTHIKTKQDHTLKNKPWQQGQSTEGLLLVLEQDFERLETKVQRIEAYVTSDRFKVDREFNNL